MRLLGFLAILLISTASAVGLASAAAGARDDAGRSRETRPADHRHKAHQRKRQRNRHRARQRQGRADRGLPTEAPTPTEPEDAVGEGSTPAGDLETPPRLNPQQDPHLVWADEFNGPEGAAPNPSNWNLDIGGNGWGNNELQYYTARRSNASLNGEGDLVIAARAETYRGADGVERGYTSARLQSLDRVEFTYGLLEARIRVPSGKGLAPAFWTLGNEAYEGDEGRWPDCGEIDAMEIFGSEPNVLSGTLHGNWPSAPHGIGNELVHSTPLTASFHTYGVEWKPDEVAFVFDGSVYATVSRDDLAPGDPWPFQHPNFLLLNLAVGGDWPGSPNASTQFPAQMLVDWVRIYR